jgi:phosphinothricin acetyltransferase
MAEVEFHEMKPKYLQDVLDIYMYYVLNTTATFHMHTLDKKEMQELVFFDNSKYKAFVMIEQGEICGYVIMSPYKKREAYIDTAETTIYLKNDKLGRGLGSLAVNYIEQYARLQGIHVLIAGICGENNRSIRVFEKNGFEKCAHYKEVGQKFGKLLDVVAYQKILN